MATLLFWRKVYFHLYDTKYSSESVEVGGHMVGIGENVGHAMTYNVFHPRTKKIVLRASLRPFTSSDRNVRIEPPDGESTSKSTSGTDLIQTLIHHQMNLMKLSCLGRIQMATIRKLNKESKEATC